MSGTGGLPETCHGMLTFEYTGLTQEFKAPCKLELFIEAWGASGGAGFNLNGVPPPPGGWGTRVSAYLSVEAGTVLRIHVGGRGTDGTQVAAGKGGYNGGGAGGWGSGDDWTSAGGGGGGASDVRVGGGSAEARVLVAGGGGGAGSACTQDNAVPPPGGDAGGVTGQDGGLCYSQAPSGGHGAQAMSGGVAAEYSGCISKAGTLGQGGAACAKGGGGGGGGYYGGGGGAWGGGGGGNSFVAAHLKSPSLAPGVHQQGDGLVRISW